VLLIGRKGALAFKIGKPFDIINNITYAILINTTYKPLKEVKNELD